MDAGGSKPRLHRQNPSTRVHYPAQNRRRVFDKAQPSADLICVATVRTATNKRFVSQLDLLSQVYRPLELIGW